MKMKKPGSKTSLPSTLNYMKSTVSADARREEQPKVSRRQSPQTSLNSSSLHRKSPTNSSNISLNPSKDATGRLARTPSFKMRKTSKKKSSLETLKVEGETCSSTLKGSKFPDYQKPGSGGAEYGVKVCSYSCCSLNGHHRPLLPPIKSFVSARRRALKTERGLKLRPEARPALSSPNCDEHIARDAPASTQEGVPDVHEDFMIKFDEFFVDAVVPQLLEMFDEESLCDLLLEGTKTPNTTARCNASDGVEHNLKEESPPNEEATKDCVDIIKHDQDLTNEENECNVVNHRNIIKIPETGERSSRRAAVGCEESNQESDEPRLINPQGLHFLAVEADPEAEMVKLRHQQLDARKNAEEWMVDYALREAVTRISPACQRKVALLVEAFERVLLSPSKT